MSLFLISMAIGILPARFGSVFSVLFCAWLVAGCIVASTLFSAGSLINLLPSIALVFAGFNSGLATGLGMNFVSTSQATAA